MFQKCKPKQLLHLILSISILINSTFAYAARDLPVHIPQFDGQKYEGIGYFQEQTPLDLNLEKHLNDMVAEGEVPSIEAIAQVEDLSDVILRFHQAVVKDKPTLRARYEKEGPEKFAQLLANDKIGSKQGDINIEYTSIDGYPVARIKHERSGVAVVFLDEAQIQESSKGLFLYLTRQHFNSGNKRPDKLYIDEKGKKRHVVARDNIYVWTSSDAINKVEFKPRLKRFTKEWWKEYWTATVQKPAKYHVGVGTASGVAQTAQNLAVAGVFTWTAAMLGADVYTTSDPMWVAALSFGFGVTLGIFTRTFHNWRSRGPKHIRQKKDEVVNVGMYLGIKAVSEDGIVKTFNILDASRQVAAMFNIFQFIASWKINNTLKQPWNKFGDIIAHERDDQSNLVLRVPKRIGRDERGYYRVKEWFPWQWETPMKLADWNRQFKYYLPRNALTMTDRIWFTWWMHEYATGNAEWYMPWASTAMLAAMIPVSWRLVNYWVKKHYPDTVHMKIVEDESRAFMSWRGAYEAFISNVVEPVTDFIKGVPEKADEIADVIPSLFTKPLSLPEIDKLDLRSPEQRIQLDEVQPAPVNSSDCAEKLKGKQKVA